MYTRVLQALFDAGNTAPTRTQRAQGFAALVCYARHANTPMPPDAFEHRVTHLLRCGCDPNQPIPTATLAFWLDDAVGMETEEEEEEEQILPLHLVLLQYRPQSMRLLGSEYTRVLLAAGAHPDAPCTWCMRAVHLAAHCGHDLEHLRLLLAAGADANAPATFEGLRPLHMAAMLDAAHDGVRLLLAARADAALTNAAGEPPLFCAVICSSTQVARLLLERAPGTATAVNSSGQTPLHLATTAAVARMLLQAGADANAADYMWGRTPLMHATALASGGLISLLLEEGRADVNAVTRDGRSALSFACRIASATKARRLLAAGADPDAIGVERRFVMAFALERARALERRLAGRPMRLAGPRMLHHSFA